MTMHQYLSDRVLSINPSPSVVANAMVSVLLAQGKDIVNLTIGEPDFATPSHITKAAFDAVENGETHYTSTSGTPALLDAIVEKLRRDNGLNYARNEVVAGCGGKHIIFHALSATLNRGDEVVIHAPYWVSYPDLVKLHEACPVIVVTDESTNFKLTPEKLENSISAKTKWVILNYPNNPSGAVYSKSELAALGEVLTRHPHVLVMADEIYEHFVYGASKHVSLLNAAPELKDRVLLVNGVSKGYAMTGWRLGFGAGPAPLIAAMAKLLSQTTTCPSSVSQAAAVAAFTGTQEPVQVMRDTYETRRAKILSGLEDIPGITFIAPEGAFYIFVKVSGLIGKKTPSDVILETDQDVVTFLLDYSGVATVCGAAYGLSPYIRLSFASAEATITEGCKRLRAACRCLK